MELIYVRDREQGTQRCAPTTIWNFLSCFGIRFSEGAGRQLALVSDFVSLRANRSLHRGGLGDLDRFGGLLGIEAGAPPIPGCQHLQRNER